MAKPSLQVKNIASLLLAAGASIASGLASRRFFDPHPTEWIVPTMVFVLCLGSQLALVFVESKEEGELSLNRKRRMEAERHRISGDGLRQRDGERAHHARPETF